MTYPIARSLPLWMDSFFRSIAWLHMTVNIIDIILNSACLHAVGNLPGREAGYLNICSLDPSCAYIIIKCVVSATVQTALLVSFVSSQVLFDYCAPLDERHFESLYFLLRIAYPAPYSHCH